MDTETDERRAIERRLHELARQHEALVAQLEHGQRHFQQLARSVWRVQEEERRRLARELHDGIGQNLTAIMHFISQAMAQLPTGADAAHAGLERTRTLVATTLEETRALSRLLRPQILDDLGLAAALRWLARTAGETSALEVVLDLPEPLPPLDDDRCTLIFRSVQEALTNAARHARAARVDIVLRQHDRGVRLDIRDDGQGCDPARALAAGSAGGSSGIGGMRDRVRLFSGEFRIESAPGHGFGLCIEFPLQASGTKQPS
jgi:signal transduction histidine kinase